MTGPSSVAAAVSEIVGDSERPLLPASGRAAFASPEVEHLYGAVRLDLDVGRL